MFSILCDVYRFTFIIISWKIDPREDVSNFYIGKIVGAIFFISMQQMGIIYLIFINFSDIKFIDKFDNTFIIFSYSTLVYLNYRYIYKCDDHMRSEINRFKSTDKIHKLIPIFIFFWIMDSVCKAN